MTEEEQQKSWDETVFMWTQWECNKNTGLGISIAAADAELKRLESELVRYAEDAIVLAAKNRELKSEVAELDARNAQLADMHTAACGEHAATLQKVKRLEGEVKEEKERADGNFASCERIQEKLSDASNKCKRLEAEVEELRKSLRAIHEGASRQLAEPRDHADDQFALTAICTEAEKHIDEAMGVK